MVFFLKSQKKINIKEKYDIYQKNMVMEVQGEKYDRKVEVRSW